MRVDSTFIVACVYSQSGVIEIVPNARTVASIQKAAGGSFSAFSDEPLLDWLTKETLNDVDALNAAKDKFTISCAGECLAILLTMCFDTCVACLQAIALRPTCCKCVARKQL
jgi:hypothetical protein